MAWLIALGCLALLVGSVSMLRPSPRERKQALLRQEAQSLGLRVRLQSLQIPGEAEPRRVAVYHLPRSDSQTAAYRARPAGCVIVRAANGGLDTIDEHWQFLESDPVTRALTAEIALLVRDLDARIFGLLSGPGSVGVCWDERGPLDAVAEIKRLLERFGAMTSR